MLDAAELASARAAMVPCMSDVAIHSRANGPIPGNDAGVVSSWSVLSTSIPCLILPGMSAQTEMESRIANVIITKIVFPYATDIQNGDKLEITGMFYRVLGVERRSESLSLLTKCCEVAG